MRVQISDFPLLALKFTKFIMSFFETNRQFSSTFAALSSVMKDDSSVLFHPKRYIGFRRKEPIKSKYSDFQLLA